MGSRQKQRTKGNVKPSSSARTAELMAREGGGNMGFIGFGSMSGDLGYVPQSQDDYDSTLDADFRMVLRKLTKKDVVTKLKALQEFGVLCKDKDQETVIATLPHWARLYGRLAIDHDKRVREATQQAFQQLVERVKRNLAPHLRSLMGPWLVAQCDTYPAAALTARAAFSSAFSPSKQKDAIGYCSVQVIKYLDGNLFKETPTTLSDANTTTAEEQEEKYLRVITSSLHALGELVSMVNDKDLPTVSEQMTSMMGEAKLWKITKHKTPMVRAAFFNLLGSVCKHLPDIAEAHLARISPALLGNLDEVQSVAVPALWEAVLTLVSQLPDCWSHVNPRKAVLPKLWSFLKIGGQGCASSIYPNLLPFLSKIPADVIGNGQAFYQQYFDHFKTGLCSDSVSKMPAESEAVVKAYIECLRFVISRNLTMDENCCKIQALLIEDHLMLLLESSVAEDNSRLSTTSLYSQTATLITYLQKQISNQATSDQSATNKAANNILTMLWDNVTKLCLRQIQIHPPDVSELALERITTLLHTFVCPDKAEELQKSKEVVNVKFDLPEGTDENNSQVDNQNQKADGGNERTSFTSLEAAMSGVLDLASISEDLSNLACQLVNSCFMTAKASQSLPHLKFLSRTVATFPITPVFSEILNVNSCLESKEANAIQPDGESKSTYGDVHTAALECFHKVLLPWVKDLDSDDMSMCGKQETEYVVDMVYVALQCAHLEQKAAVLDEVCCGTSSPLVLHKLITKIQTLSDSAFLSGWLKSAKFGEKVVDLADSLCHMTTDNQSVIRKQSWDLISLGLSTDDQGEPKMDALYAEKVLLKFTEALQASKVEGQQERAHNAVSFICDVASHFFSGVEGCMLIKSTEKLLFALFQIGCSDTAVLSDTLRDKINAAWNTGVKVLVKQTGGLLSEDGFLYKVANWIKSNLLTSTHALLRCHHLAEAAYTLCMAVLSSLPVFHAEPSCLHTMEELLALMLPSDEEWNLHDNQLPNKWQIPVLLDGTLTYPSLPSTMSDDKPEAMPTSVVLTAFVASLLQSREDEHEERLPWQFSFMESAILEMAHALQWCKGMMGLKAKSKVDACVPTVSHVPLYCYPVAMSLQLTLDTVLPTLNPEEWKTLIGKAIDRSMASGGLWATSLGSLLACYGNSTSSTPKCNIYDMIGGADRLVDISLAYLHTLECVIPYLTTDQVLEVLQINTAVLITSDFASIPNINGGLGLLSIINQCVQHPQWYRITQYDLVISCLEQLMTWRDGWEHGFLFNCNLFEADVELIPINIKVIGFLQQVVERIPASLSSQHWDFVLCSLVSWIQSCTENIKDLTSNASIAALCCTVCDLLTSSARLLGNPSTTLSNLPSNLATEWKEFFSEAAFTVMLPVLVELTEDNNFSNLSVTEHRLLQSLCEAVSHTPEEHLHDNKLPAKLHAGSWLPDNLQTLTRTLCPMLRMPLRCVQLVAYQMLTRVMASVTKHDEEHLQNSSKEDEEEITLTPPPALKDILDSSEVLMESLFCDVTIGECVIMEPGCEAYHDTLMYLLGWRLYLTIFKAATPEVRNSYAVHMRETKRVEHLLENLFCLMPQVPTLSDSSKEASSKQSKTKSTQVTMFTEEPVLRIKDGTPSSLEIQHQACAVYLSSLEELPAMVRQWWNSQDKRIAPLVEKFTSKYVSPVLCTRELQEVQSQPTAFDNMTVKARPMTWEVIATYAVEELSMDLGIQLATNHPLGAITVDSVRKVGVSHSQWRNWMLQLTTFLTHQNGSILDGLKLWKRNVDKRFEGVDDCMICFSVIHGTNYSLPKLTCKTCKKKFHSACLYKWFSTSNQSSCPLCRSPF